MKVKKSHVEFWSLTSNKKELNDNNEEQQYFLNVRVCFSIYHTISSKLSQIS